MASRLSRQRAAPSSRRQVWRTSISVDLRLLILGAVTIGTLLAVGAFDPAFLSVSNLRFMLMNCVVLTLLSFGQTLVLATRGIDLSVSPVLGLTAMVTGLLAQDSGLPLLAAVAIAVAIGLMLGALNGLLVARLTIPPIITTLGTYSLYSGLIFVYSDGNQVTTVPPAYAQFGNGVIIDWFPVPIALLVLAFVTLAMMFMLGFTPFGRALLAVGNNQTAAFNAGIAVRRIQVGAYTISGFLAGLSGLMFVCYTGSATVTTGTGDHMELQSIAVALIGGTAIAGGRGNILGTLLGSIFLSVVLTALVFIRVPPIWHSAGEGLMILLAVTTGMRQLRDAGVR